MTRIREEDDCIKTIEHTRRPPYRLEVALFWFYCTKRYCSIQMGTPNGVPVADSVLTIAIFDQYLALSWKLYKIGP